MSTENANPEHEQYMRLALDLARRGIGTVEPNPAVGCVIVQANHIIGKGWHEKFGGPHAEINALSDCWKHGYNPAGATIYVTLEPCKHFGKTPPCTEAVVMAGIKKVVYAAPDPYEISGGGANNSVRRASKSSPASAARKPRPSTPPSSSTPGPACPGSSSNGHSPSTANSPGKIPPPKATGSLMNKAAAMCICCENALRAS